MKRPFKWWKAVPAAAYDFGLAALVLLGFGVVGPRIVLKLVRDWPTRPGEVVVGGLILAVAFGWSVVATPKRLYYLIGAVWMWRRQRERQRRRRGHRAAPSGVTRRPRGPSFLLA